MTSSLVDTLARSDRAPAGETEPGTPSASRRPLDPILLLGTLIVCAAVLTWVLPAGRYERALDAHTGQMLVVPGSYHGVASSPVGPWAALLAIPAGLTNAASVIFYIFLAGGALTVVESTGAIARILDLTVARVGNRPPVVLLLVSSLFLVGGATYAMYEEILAFVPILCVLMRRLGLDVRLAVAVSLGTAVVAACFSPFNTFHLGISQPMAELPLFSGLGFRLATFVVAMGFWLGYLWWAAGAYATGPAPGRLGSPRATAERWRPRDLAVLAIMNGGMACLVTGAMAWQWGIDHFSAVFVAIGFAAGLVGGLGWRGTAARFADGFRALAFAAILVGFARAIAVILDQGAVLDTIANLLFGPLQRVSHDVAAVLLFASQSAISFPMPSDSGKAMVTLPIAIPLADLLGLSRQVVVNGYMYSTLFSGLVTPTAGGLLAMLALAGVPYQGWLRFMAPPLLVLALLSAAFMVIGARFGVG